MKDNKNNNILKVLSFSLVLNTMVSVIAYFTLRSYIDTSYNQIFNLKMDNLFEVTLITILYILLLIIGISLMKFIQKKKKTAN